MPNHLKARVFMSGRSQHVTIPLAFRFRTPEVYIRRDPATGEIILSEVPNIAEVFAALDAADIPRDFMNDRHRQPPQQRPVLDHLSGEEHALDRDSREP